MIFSVLWEQETNLLSAIRGFEDALLTAGVLNIAPPSQGDFLDFFDGAQHLEIDKTAITPGMLKLLFDLGHSVGPKHTVGIGTYQGLPILAVAAGARLRSRDSHAVGIDVDVASNVLARRNAEHLELNGNLQFIDHDGVAYLKERTQPIDLLYLDLDDAKQGKKGYVDCFLEAAPLLREGAIVLAHDAISPTFTEDLKRLREAVSGDGRFTVLVDIPVDSAGLFLASM